MAKERVAAIFIGVIMIMSVAGFALNAAMSGTTQTPEIKIPTIVDRPLTTEEVVYLLNSGKVVMEYYHAENCTDCTEKTTSLESFAQKMSEFMVLQEVAGNETSVQMIGIQGKIVDLGNMTLTDQNLMDTFCTIAIAQPPECLMTDF
jgi:hypothetical protein